MQLDSSISMNRFLRSHIAIIIVVGASTCLGQPPAERTISIATSNNDLNVLVELLTEELGLNVIYNQEQLNQKRITIKSKTEVPVSSLLGILEQSLRENGLALVDAKVPGWKSIVDISQLPPSEAKQLDISTEFVPLEHVAATELATQLKEVLSAQAKAVGTQDGEQAIAVEVSTDTRTNQLLLTGQRTAVAEAIKIAKSLDVGFDVVTRTYAFRYIGADRIDKLIKDLLPPRLAKEQYRSILDQDANSLVVTTTVEIHENIERLQDSRDTAPNQERSPIEFYRIKNLPVTELLGTIRSIERRSGSNIGLAGFNQFGGGGGFQQFGSDGRIRPAGGFGFQNNVLSGPNRLPAVPGQLQVPLPPGFQAPFSDPSGRVVDNSRVIVVPTGQPGTTAATPNGAAGTTVADGQVVIASGAQAPQQDQRGITDLLSSARVSADVNTNTLIVVAEPAVQKLYADLIEQLDKRRAQVLIEAQFITIDTTDDFSLGVEVSSGDRDGAMRALAFTSFGLSTVDPISGALALLPGLGFNGTVVDADVADVVVRALTSHSRSRVTSAPKILVNDNATGQLTSVSEVPFTSVNASQTVATTSFAGFAEAGTTITVTPRISDDDHLQLDFTITQNTFTGAGSDGVPPPRQTDEVTSQVTIPDGHTIIVGGLKQSNTASDYTGFPLIEKIPILRLLGGNQTNNSSRGSLFVFIKPVILREDKFKDLKYLSARDGNCAGICPQYPTSQPLLVR